MLEFTGGADRDRTDDLMNAIHMDLTTKSCNFSISPDIPTSSPFVRAAQALAPREGGLRGIFLIQPGVIEKLLEYDLTI